MKGWEKMELDMLKTEDVADYLNCSKEQKKR
jgi:hypothetical protein